MTAEQISAMIKRVTGRKITARCISSTAISLLCRGLRSNAGIVYRSDEIESILRYYEMNPAAFVGKG